MDDEDQGSELEQQQAELEQQQQELEQQNAEQQEKQRVEEKLLKNKIKFICMNLAVGSRTTLKETEKQTMKKAKKFPNLKNDIQKVNSLLAINKTKMAMKAMSSSPAFFYVFIGALILVLIICVVAAVGSIIPSLFPDDDGTGEVGSMFGVTGKDFYGARMVYIDDEKATISIIEDYVELVEDGINEAKAITTVTSGGADVNVTLEINIALPNEEFDYSTFDETAFQTDYATLYTTIFDVAKVVYKADNSVDYSGLSLVECVNGILYFGFDQTIMTEVSKIVTDVITANVTDTSQSSALKTDLDTAIGNKLSTLYAQQTYNIRAEKLFVKDYIFESDDDKMENVSKENYVAFIFMPKTNVTFTKFSFSVGGANLSEFSISLTNNGSEISLKKDDADYGDESSNSYIYSTNDNLSVNADTFADIDANNLSALSSGLSLFDIVENVENYSIYLQTNENSIYTIKKNGVVANLSNSEVFNFVEFETSWE